MNKFFNLGGVYSFAFLSTSLFASAENHSSELSKTNVYVQLDSNRTIAHKQLKELQGMDLAGVNFKKNRAEVYATKSDLEHLKNSNLTIIPKEQRQKLSADLSSYLNPTQVREQLSVINQNFSNLTHLSEIGRTHGDLPLMALEISSKPGNLKRPVVLFNGMHHAREVMSAEVLMHMAKVLTEQYGQDAEITEWLNSYRIILVPQVNPDGNTLVHNGKNMWRKNGAKYDGNITGVDLNRNYPGYWNHCNGSSGYPYSEIYRGPSAGSEPETQAMMRLVSQTKPVASISYHSYSEMIMYPFACSNVQNPSKDLFIHVAKYMKSGIRDDYNQLNTYELGTAPELLYDADGGDDDWYWKDEGVISFTIEVNSSSFQPNYNQWRNITVERQEGGWKNLLRQMKKSGFHGFVQTNNADQITYSIEKLLEKKWVAFDADDTVKKFALRSQKGLLYQLTEPGRHQINFYRENDLIKTISVEIEDAQVDLGTIVLD